MIEKLQEVLQALKKVTGHGVTGVKNSGTSQRVMERRPGKG